MGIPSPCRIGFSPFLRITAIISSITTLITSITVHQRTYKFSATPMTQIYSKSLVSHGWIEPGTKIVHAPAATVPVSESTADPIGNEAATNAVQNEEVATDSPQVMNMQPQPQE